MVAKYSEWTRGQDEALLNKLGGMDVALKLLDCRKITVIFDSDSKQAAVTAQPASRSRKVLSEATRVTLPERTNAFDPHQFFQTRSGLRVWEEFRDRILAVAGVTDLLPEQQITSYDLLQDANDAQVRANLPEGHVFEDASAFCVILAGLIEQQANGEEGMLLTNDYANIFYVCGANGEVFAVRVGWFAYGRQWDVDAISLSDPQWHAGNRVFPRTC